MKSIGILTFWSVPNYGCFLQAYALQKVVAQLFPEDDVRQIAYLNKKHYDFYYRCRIDKKNKLWMFNPHFYKKILQQIVRYKVQFKLHSFIKYYDIIPHTIRYTEETLSKLDLDTLILGSDIIWDYSTDLTKDDGYLFGVGINAGRLISYAPSFCNAALAKPYPPYVEMALKNMDAISVRDDISYQTVEQITGIAPLILLDPTFLWDFKDDPNIQEPELSRPIIVVYGNDFSDKIIRDAIDHKKKHNVEFVNLDFVGKKYSWCDYNISRRRLSPFEWLGYMKAADIVMTSTYHGLIFGLIFEKKVVFYPTGFINRKAGYLIKYLGLENVLLERKTFDEKVDHDWKYGEIRKKIEHLRGISLDFLRRNV